MKEVTKDLLKPDAVFITNKKNIANKRITQDFKFVTGNKLDEMTEMLEKEVNTVGGDSTKIRRTLIFTNTKKLSDFIAIHLCNKGIKASCINGDRSQQLREEALGQFRRGEVAVLVSTDVCCRGIDIKHLDHVINYDIPIELIQYIHRIGRTGRICHGCATTFVTDPYEPILQEIAQVRFMGITVIILSFRSFVMVVKKCPNPYPRYLTITLSLKILEMPMILIMQLR